MTHRLAQDARSYAYMGKLLQTVTAHYAAQWLNARSVFGL